MIRPSLQVLHVTEASNAGVGEHVLDLAEGLRRRQHRCHLVYSPRRIDDAFRDRIGRFDNNGVTSISMRRSPHWSDGSASARLARLIRELGPFDIVHAHSTKAGLLCRLGPVSRAARIVYTPNGIFSMNPMANLVVRRFIRTLERRLSVRTQAIIAVSPEEERHMVSLGVAPEKIHMIPNGIRERIWVSKEQARHKLGLPADALVVGFLGRLADQKNPLLLLKAFAKVPVRERLRLAMVGTGPLELSARKLGSELGISERVDWLGYRKAAEAMPAFDVFVMPSRYEGMPYVMMEAASLGLPVVATRVGGTSLGIEDGKNGFVVPRGDVLAMAGALQRLVDDDSLRAECSRNAIQKSLEFTVHGMVDKTIQLYQRFSV